MTVKTTPIKTTPFDPAKYLDDEQSIADYLTDMLEDGNPGLLAAALGDLKWTQVLRQQFKLCEI